MTYYHFSYHSPVEYDYIKHKKWKRHELKLFKDKEVIKFRSNDKIYKLTRLRGQFYLFKCNGKGDRRFSITSITSDTLYNEYLSDVLEYLLNYGFKSVNIPAELGLVSPTIDPDSKINLCINWFRDDNIYSDDDDENLIINIVA